MAKRLSSTITKHAFRNGSETGNTSHRHLPCLRRRSYGGDESRRPTSKSLDTCLRSRMVEESQILRPRSYGRSALTLNFMERFGLHWSNPADQRLFRRTWHVDIRAGSIGVFSNVSVVRRLRDFSPVRRVRRPDRASARANFPRVRTHDCLVDSALCHSDHGPQIGKKAQKSL